MSSSARRPSPSREELQAKGIAVARIHGAVDRAPVDLETRTDAVPIRRGAVVVFTPSASLSLQASEQLADGARPPRRRAVGLMHNVRYSGLAGRQILGRTHRDHQVSPWWVSYAEGTVEEAHRQDDDRAVQGHVPTRPAPKRRPWNRVAELLGVSWLPGDALSANE